MREQSDGDIAVASTAPFQGHALKKQGQRMRKLHQAFHRTVKFALRGVPPEEFHAYFPNGQLPDPIIEAAYDGYGQALHESRIFIEREFEDVCEEANLGEKLHSLDILCAEQGLGNVGESGEADAPTPPTKAVREAIVQAKEEEIERLKAILEEVKRRENEAEKSLQEKKKLAREFMELAAPLQCSLSEVQSATSTWARRRSQKNPTVSGHVDENQEQPMITT